MSGIFLVIIVAAWFFAVKSLTKSITSTMKRGIIKNTTHFLLFAFFFLLPVTDEIIGGFQFRALCTPANMLIYNTHKVEGKTVQYKAIPQYSIEKGILSVRVTQSDWVNPDTGEVLITHKMFYAKGGWLSQLIGFPQGSPPYTYDGHCDLREYYELFNKLDIKRLKGHYGESG